MIDFPLSLKVKIERERLRERSIIYTMYQKKGKRKEKKFFVQF